MNGLHVGRAVGFYWGPRDTEGKIRANNESKPPALHTGSAPGSCGARCVPVAGENAAQRPEVAGRISKCPQSYKSHGGGGGAGGGRVRRCGGLLFVL